MILNCNTCAGSKVEPTLSSVTKGRYYVINLSDLYVFPCPYDKYDDAESFARTEASWFHGQRYGVLFLDSISEVVPSEVKTTFVW